MSSLAPPQPGERPTPAPRHMAALPVGALRVLHVLPSLHGGGMERAAIRLIRASAGAADSACIHGLCVLQQADRELLAACRPAAQVWVLGEGLDRPGPFWHFWNLRRVIRRFRPHVVHARSTAVWPDAVLATRGVRNTKLLLSFHGKTDLRRPALRRRLLNRWAAARADAVLAVSRESAEYIRREWGVCAARLTAIHNGVDTARFRPASDPEESRLIRAGLGLRSDQMLVLCVANLLPVKGIDVLLRAWQQVHAQMPAARLLLVGDGPLRGELQELAWALECRESVLFAGRRENVAELLRAADLFVLPSRYEACSNAILEAQASGVAVVACDTGGNSELIVPGVTGWLVRPESPRMLAERLLAVMSDDELRRQAARAGRERAVSAFGEALWLEAYASLYCCLASSPEALQEASPCAE